MHSPKKGFKWLGHSQQTLFCRDGSWIHPGLIPPNPMALKNLYLPSSPNQQPFDWSSETQATGLDARLMSVLLGFFPALLRTGFCSYIMLMYNYINHLRHPQTC